MIEITNNNLLLDDEGYAVSEVDSFIDGLTTLKGSVIGNHEYGTIFPTLKHRSFNNDWKIDCKRCFKDACNHDGRLEYKGSKLYESDIAIGYIGFIVYIGSGFIEGKINV